MRIDVIAIFFIFSGSFSKGGMKYKHEIPPNATMFPRPEIKVLYNPFPKIGNALWNEKFCMFPIKRNIILIITIGKMIEMAFTFDEKCSVLV